MNRVTYFLAGLLLGAFGSFLALKYHVVRATDGVHLIPKTEAAVKDVYVDIRRYGVSDWKEHPSLVSAIMKSDQRELLEGSARDAIRNTVGEFLGGESPR